MIVEIQKNEHFMYKFHTCFELDDFY